MQNFILRSFTHGAPYSALTESDELGLHAYLQKQGRKNLLTWLRKSRLMGLI